MELVKTMPVADIMTMAKTFAESGLFEDTKQLAQAFVKIQAGQEIGIAPFQSMTGIHIIKGKPTIGSGIIASRIKGSGKYDYAVIKNDDKACSIDFFEGKKKIGNSTFTIEDATKAGTQNMGKFPRNMLFARAISNGVKWYCPDVFSGPVYTPEEMETVTEDIPYKEVIENTLPKITDKMFKQLCDRVSKGEKDIIGKTLENFQLTQAQLDTVNGLVANSTEEGEAA